MKFVSREDLFEFRCDLKFLSKLLKVGGSMILKSPEGVQDELGECFEILTIFLVYSRSNTPL